jgi:hypothetical protein
MAFVRPDAAAVVMHRETMAGPAMIRPAPKPDYVVTHEQKPAAAFTQTIIGREGHVVKIPVISHGV